VRLPNKIAGGRRDGREPHGVTRRRWAAFRGLAFRIRCVAILEMPRPHLQLEELTRARRVVDSWSCLRRARAVAPRPSTSRLKLAIGCAVLRRPALCCGLCFAGARLDASSMHGQGSGGEREGGARPFAIKVRGSHTVTPSHAVCLCGTCRRVE
jgi:hypothetical protein